MQEIEYIPKYSLRAAPDAFPCSDASREEMCYSSEADRGIASFLAMTPFPAMMPWIWDVTASRRQDTSGEEVVTAEKQSQWRLLRFSQ